MNRIFTNVSLILFLALFSLLSLAVQANNTKVYKSHTVHYNAFPTDSLPPEMTQRYHLKRSKNMALVNISIIKNEASIQIQGVKSTVSGVLKNLMAQEKKLSFQEIHEGQAYYYIAEVPVEHNEVVKFKIQIKTSDNQNYELIFDKQFATR
jgi:Domain of unknown function (DUF4426)